MCSFPCPDGKGEVGTSLSLLPSERDFRGNVQTTGPFHLGTMRRHRDCRIQSWESEGEILWPVGELIALGAGCASRICETRMNEMD